MTDATAPAARRWIACCWRRREAMRLAVELRAKGLAVTETRRAAGYELSGPASETFKATVELASLGDAMSKTALALWRAGRLYLNGS